MLTPLSPPAYEAILPLTEARAAVNIAPGDLSYDVRLTQARNGAIDWAEGYTSKALSSRSFRWDVSRFSRDIRLPMGPVSAVTGISYYDGSGVDTALVAADWFLGGDVLRAAHGRAFPYANGAPGGVRITFTAGYAANIPAFLISGVIVAMAAMFADVESPDLSAAMACCDRHRTMVL